MLKGICFRFKVKQPYHESDLNALHVNVSRTTFYSNANQEFLDSSTLNNRNMLTTLYIYLYSKKSKDKIMRKPFLGLQLIIIIV